MFRMIAILCAGIFLTLLIGGREGAQLAGDPVSRKAPAAAALPERASAPRRVPVVAPVAVAAVAYDPARRATYAPAAAPALPQRPAPAPQPEPAALPAAEPEPDLPVWYVAANRVNVRSGPSTDDPVLDTVRRDEAVLVVSDGGAEWVEIRIEGDGVTGYVAARYLTADAPAD